MSSFIADKVVMDGVTFDDVLLVPQYSEVLPRNVELKTKFSRNITLNIPIVSAAMDTVTEAQMAIAMAREGGIGVIHKNMSIQEQAAQVRRVKRAENGLIADPITITPDQTVGDALQMMAENRIGGIPVVNGENLLVGIITNRDLRFENHMERPISEVMTTENLITIQSTDHEVVMEAFETHKVEKLPVVTADGKLRGLVTYRDITKLRDYPNACKDAMGRLRCAAGVGITKDFMDRVDALVAEGVDAVGLVVYLRNGNQVSAVFLIELIQIRGVLEVVRVNVTAFGGVVGDDVVVHYLDVELEAFFLKCGFAFLEDLGVRRGACGNSQSLIVRLPSAGCEAECEHKSCEGECDKSFHGFSPLYIEKIMNFLRVCQVSLRGKKVLPGISVRGL